MVRRQRKRISYVLPLPNSAGGHRLGVNGLAVDAENSVLYSGGRDGVVCAWDLNLDFNRRASLYDIPPTSAPSSFSNASSIHSHASTQASARDTSPASSRTQHNASYPTTLRNTVQAHTHWINDIALVYNNQALVSASSDISVKLWRPTAFGQKSTHTLGHHGDYVKCLSSPGPNFNWVASGGLDRQICLWDLTGAGDTMKIPMADDDAKASVKGSVYALAATSNLIAAGGPESVVRLWDARTGKGVKKFVGHTDIVRSILVAEDGETVMSASSDQTVKFWSLREGRCMSTLTMHNDSVWNLYSDDPRLGVFWSADRSGLVAKTDIRGKSAVDEGLCVAVCQEDTGVHRIVQAGGYIWTATTNSSINRWNDVKTEDADISIPESIAMQHRGSVATITKPRLHANSMSKHGPGDSPRFANASPARKTSAAIVPHQIPLRSILRLSNMAPFPVLRKQDVETSTLHSTTSRRKTSEAVEFDDDGPFAPVRSSPEYTIGGQHGLIKHVMLNDKRRVLTLDAAGEVMLWDLIKCNLVKSYGKKDIDDVLSEVNTMETVAHWCSVDTRTGCLTCVLEENNCFDAEMYADELEIDEEIEFKEDQRINLGKWILRYLFANLIDEEIRKDEDFRRRLFNAKYPHLVQDMERSKGPPGRLEIPQSIMTSWLDMSSAPTSASTLKPPNGIRYPQTPGLAIGIATPAVMTPGPPTTNGIPPVAKSTNLASSPHLSSSDENATLDRSSTRTSSERQSGDYFTARGVTEQQASTPGGQLSSQASPVLNGRSSSENATLTALPPAVSTESEPATSSPEKTGLKKFMRMNLIPKSLKKSDKVNDAKVLAAEEPQSDSDSRNSQADDRLNEDTLLGAVFRIRHNYELQSRSSGTEPETGVGLNIKSTLLSKEKETNSSPSLVSSSITPSLPNDTPVIKPPPQTIILIQDDNVESGGVADLWEGTVGTVGKDAEAVERVAPAWLADVLLRNTIPLKELVKVSFVLEPWQGLLPAVSTDGNTRLNANRMLRVRKILTYICDRIEPQSQEPDPDAMKPEEYLELYCHDQLVPPTMTLATIRTHVWRGGGDVLLFYKANGRKQIANTPRVTPAAESGSSTQ